MSSIVSNVDLLKQLKSACVSKWISDGYKNSYQKTCLSYFHDSSQGKITKDSFKAGCKSIMPHFSETECNEIFIMVDCKGKICDDNISSDDFFRKFQQALPKSRYDFVKKTFDKLDTSKSTDKSNGVITVADLLLLQILDPKSCVEDIATQNAVNLAKIKNHISTVFGNYNINTIINKEINDCKYIPTGPNCVTDVTDVTGPTGVTKVVLAEFMKNTVLNENETTNVLNNITKEKFVITNVDTITFSEFIDYYTDMSLRFVNDSDFKAFVNDGWKDYKLR